MSQSDFLIRAGAGNYGGDQYTGSAVLNSTLTNPLTSSINCRVFNEDNETTGQLYGIFLLTSSLSGGAFVNIDETKSVSLRMWGRSNYNGTNGGFSLIAKHNGYNSENMGIDYNYPLSGYEFGYRGDAPYGSSGQLYYKFGNYKVSNAVVFTNMPGAGFDNWVGLRMDIVPVKVNKIINGTPVSGTFKDVVRFYTASYSSPDTWVQVGDSSYELLADGNEFVPWGQYTIIGAAQQAGYTVTTSSYGFTVRAQKSNNSRTWIDDFQIFVEDAF